jgi:hypothetical protein
MASVRTQSYMQEKQSTQGLRAKQCQPGNATQSECQGSFIAYVYMLFEHSDILHAVHNLIMLGVKNVLMCCIVHNIQPPPLIQNIAK